MGPLWYATDDWGIANGGTTDGWSTHLSVFLFFQFP